MQCFVRKLHHQQNNLSYNYNARRIFDTIARSHIAKPPQLEHHISSSVIHPLHHFHSWRSHPTLSTKVRACLPQPMIVWQQLARNALPRIFSKSFLDCGPRLHCHRQSFNFNPIQNYDSYLRRWKSWLNGLTPNNAVLGLITANVAIFVLWRIADEKFMINNFTISLDNVKSGRLHTLITHAFSHRDAWHIISNMIGLYFFGMNIAKFIGPKFLLKLYLVGALGGSAFFFIWSRVVLLSIYHTKTTRLKYLRSSDD